MIKKLATIFIAIVMMVVGLAIMANGQDINTNTYMINIATNEDDSLSSIQRIYVSLAQKYDPERFGSDISPELKKSAQFVLEKLGTAFREINELRKKDMMPDLGPVDLPEDVPEKTDELPPDLPRDLSENFDFDENFDKFERGKELYRAKKFDEALILLKDAVKSGDPGYENYLYLGLCQINLPFFTDEAERHLKKAIEIAPAKSEPVHSLGKLYLTLKRKKSAKKCFERAVELEPGNIEAAQDLFRMKYPPKKRKKLFSRKK